MSRKALVEPSAELFGPDNSQAHEPGVKRDPRQDPMAVNWDGWGQCREIVRPGPLYWCGADIGAIGYKMTGGKRGPRVACYLCYTRKLKSSH